MLNPFGYTSSSGSTVSELQGIMKSVKSNMTNSKAQVLEFISKETNPQRKIELGKIFQAAEAIYDRYDGHNRNEFSGSADYIDMASKMFKLMQKQRHAGRKIFLVSLSNPILGFDCVHFTSIQQLEA